MPPFTLPSLGEDRSTISLVYSFLELALKGLSATLAYMHSPQCYLSIKVFCDCLGVINGQIGSSWHKIVSPIMPNPETLLYSLQNELHEGFVWMPY